MLQNVPESIYQQMIEAGYYFEAEVLLNGEVSITISNEDEDIDIELVPNGPLIQSKMEDMLRRQSWKRKENQSCRAGK